MVARFMADDTSRRAHPRVRDKTQQGGAPLGGHLDVVELGMGGGQQGGRRVEVGSQRPSSSTRSPPGSMGPRVSTSASNRPASKSTKPMTLCRRQTTSRRSERIRRAWARADGLQGGRGHAQAALHASLQQVAGQQQQQAVIRPGPGDQGQDTLDERRVALDGQGGPDLVLLENRAFRKASSRGG